MDGGRTTERQYSEYSEFISTQRDQDTDLNQRESTQIRRGGRDGKRKPDSVLGYTQDYRSRRTHEDCVDPDSVRQRTEQPAGGKRRVGCRPAGDRIPEVTGIHRNSQWDFPRKRALFTSDRPDSTTSLRDTPEGHTDRPLRNRETGFPSYDIRNGGDPTTERFGRLPHRV